MPHPTVDNTLEALKGMAPNATFLALGQTVFWDEPVKAVWRRLLDRYWPEAQLVAGIHDTDYFAKTTAHVPDNQEFVALSHDDGATRGLWSAAGELSSLLGSEDIPTRSYYEGLGIPFDKLAGRDAVARRQFFAEYTSAYGWRGIVQTSGRAQISHDVKLSSFGPAFVSLLDWGFEESTRCLGKKSVAYAKDIAAQIRGWVVGFLESCSEQCTLTDLYKHVLPKFYELLLDFEPNNFSVTATTELLLFNSKTYHLPRFQFVELFLNPETRATAENAYSSSVAGGGMYALDHFGDFTIPFDVVVPGKGRGTLHVDGLNVTIDFAPLPTTVRAVEPVTSLRVLAQILEREFGDQVVLVGKAVSLISMLSAEYVLIFHETASGYTDRTSAMNEALRSAGIGLKLNPILRLQYDTWSSLSGARESEFILPHHLAASFGTGNHSIAATEFARRWTEVVSEQKHGASTLRELRSVRKLLAYLATLPDGPYWSERRDRFENLVEMVKQNHVRAADIRKLIGDLRDQIKSIQGERASLEMASGEDYRSRLRPLQESFAADNEDVRHQIAVIESDRSTRFGGEIHKLSLSAQNIRHLLKNALVNKKAMERTSEVVAAKSEIADIEREANMAKLNAARIAYLTIHGLPHTNSRPTSWWISMVDPTGNWFDNITESLHARLEEV